MEKNSQETAVGHSLRFPELLITPIAMTSLVDRHSGKPGQCFGESGQQLQSAEVQAEPIHDRWALSN